MPSRWRTLLSPLRVPDCRTLFAAQAVSGIGDWAGRLALAALVFDRSQSAWAAGAVTVAALIPWLGPGQMLATLADRWGRIAVMVAADLLRAALFALMLIGQPVWSLLVLAFLAGACVPPFVGSRSAALVELTPPDRYPATLSLYGVLSQSEVMLGYAVGGVVIAAAGARFALAANAVTFVLSALLLARLRSSAAATRHARATVGIAGVRAGLRVWRADPLCRRALVLFVGVSMFAALPEALVVPYAAEIGVPSRAVGVLAAVIAIGTITGMLLVPTDREHAALLRATAIRTAVAAFGTGALFAVGVSAPIAAIAFVASGLVDAVSVPTNQVVGERLPGEGRAATMAVAGGLHYGAQAATIAVAGAMASVWSPRVPLVAGMLAAACVALWAAVTPVRAADPATLTAELQPSRRSIGSTVGLP